MALEFAKPCTGPSVVSFVTSRRSSLLNTEAFVRVQAMDVTKEEQENKLLSAAKEGRVSEIKDLIGRGVNIHCKNEPIRPIVSLTPHKFLDACMLHLCMFFSCSLFPLLAFLVGFSFRNGWTAMHHAAHYGQTSTLSLLLEKGANIRAKNKEGGTVLYLAAANGHTATISLLLKHGADIKAVTI
eukprot:gene23927-31054_t